MIPGAGLDDVEKRKFLTLPGLELRTLGRPARSQSLYRLGYPGSCLLYLDNVKWRTINNDGLERMSKEGPVVSRDWITPL
jgi:hypothetical protein